METLSARQRLKLGKAAFLNIVKNGWRQDESPCGDQGTKASMESSRLERNIQRKSTFRVHGLAAEGFTRLQDQPQSQDPPVISAADPEKLTTQEKRLWLEREYQGQSSAKLKRRRLRKLQQEATAEAEEDRVRKDEEKARRELIKQEYLQRKQESLMEEQGSRSGQAPSKDEVPQEQPKSLHREEYNSLSKGYTTRNSLKVSMLIKAQGSAAGCGGADLSCSHRGSTLSLATETDSVISGGAEPQRAASVCSVESFPMLSRASSRNMERDWENGSIASSIMSTEYNGESWRSATPTTDHLFRDGGCQFRAIYSYSPDTEEIVLDRKQFTAIPTKSVSVSVDALTMSHTPLADQETGARTEEVRAKETLISQLLFI
ncbi:unnamed protein product [Pleuronectes platessa]|uniref:Uncharacterized protein n=1 Tax=Pleuronectes platessa TaxID=8262 RepID=A0A9N7YS01_PLEPL|nr:unnamed protein product [Pleuronectes platessa]